MSTIHFQGVTTNDDWNNKIKNFAAPWGEIEIPGQIILTMRASSLKTVTDIVALGSVYSDIMTWVNKFAGLEKRFRTERFVFDIQIGGGKYGKKFLQLHISLLHLHYYFIHF